MAFWGIEVKTGKPFTHRFDYNLGRLHISQATLGTGSSTNRSVLQCNIGDKSPILLCALLPDKNESCLLDLEFEEEDEVIFSVLGPRSVHLTGYYITPPDEAHCHEDEDDYDSYGEDIAESDTDQSSDFSAEEDEYDDFIGDDSDDMEMFPPSPRRKSSVVIEEIVDDEKPANENGSSKRLKKNQISDSEGDAGKQIVVKGVAGSEVLESEDEDGFPISSVDKKKADGRSNAESKSEKKVSKESKKKVEEGTSHVKGKKRKIDTIVQDEEADKSKVDEQPRDDSLPSSDVGQQSEGKPKKEKKERSKKKNQGVNEAKPEGSKVDNIVKDKPKEEIINDKKTETADHVADQEQSEGKKKKKKNKKKKSKVQESDETAEKKESTEVTPSKKEKVKHSKVRTLANGLIIEDIDMGKPNGKKATPGNKVSVRYIGKLKSNGKIFDSNIARAPFKFRLGAGEVIKGWDFGVNGMQIGDKRRLTIPPSMGYGSKGAGGKIPPNAWLVFDVELLDVR